VLHIALVSVSMAVIETMASIEPRYIFVYSVYIGESQGCDRIQPFSVAYMSKQKVK